MSPSGCASLLLAVPPPRLLNGFTEIRLPAGHPLGIVCVSGDQALVAFGGVGLADPILFAGQFFVPVTDLHALVCQAVNQLISEKQHIIGVARYTSNRGAVLCVDHTTYWNF